MKTMDIKILIDKYFEGETSLKEEQILFTFFTQNDMPDNLKSYAEQFRLLSEAANDKIDSDVFDEKVLTKFNDRQFPIISKFNKQYLYYISGIAASIIIIFGIIFQFNSKEENHSQSRKKIENIYNDPQTAYLETKKILLFVSLKLNQGLKETEKISTFDKYQEIVKEKKEN